MPPPGQNYQAQTNLGNMPPPGQNYQAQTNFGNMPPPGQNYQAQTNFSNMPPPGQNYQAQTGSGNMPPPGQNYQAPSYAVTPPSLKTGYPMPGGLQPFTPSFLPSQSNIPEAARRQATELINRAYDLSHAGRNEDAIPLLKQAEQLNPASSAAHLDLSASYIALKRYDEALTETTILLSMNPDDERSYINYLAAAIGANRMQDALRVGQDYLHRFPNGQNRTKLSNEMVAVEHELDRRANAHGVMPPPGAPDNYLFYATPNGIRRWPPGTMPLRVYINNGNQCKGFVPDFQSVLISSFMTWQNATRGMIRFIPVDDLRSANIECRWTDSAANVSLAAEAGEAKVETIRNNIDHVTITLLTCRPESPSEKLTSNLLQQVCLHEIGHSLGLDGHSDRAQDIMYCSTNPNVEHPNLTQRDINTLYLIYQ
jgi:hypothetical protein